MGMMSMEDEWNADITKELERLTKALQYEQWRKDRRGTHAQGCYLWGVDHYECALRKIDELQGKKSG